MRSSTIVRYAVCAVLACSLVVGISPEVAVANGSNWHWLSPLPRGETLNAVDLVTADIGYAVGNTGCIMKTYNGGTDWIEKNSTTTDDLHAVAFIDADTGWAGGDNGVIVKTDGTSGATWTRQVTGVTDGYIVDLFFLDANKGWAADEAGRIFRTVDGGTTWAYTDVPGADFSAVWFVSDTLGFATSRMDGTIYKSTTGGVTWSQVSVIGAPLTDIAFKPGSTLIGWITVWRAGNNVGSAYRTDNGGLTWNPVNIGGGSAFLEGVAWAPDGSAVWMVGGISQPRKIFTFADAAAPTVTALAYAPDYEDFLLYDVDCASADNVLAVGMYGTIVHSDDGSTFADRARVLPNETVGAIQFLDLRTGYLAATDGTVYKTTSAGKTWAATPTGVTEPLYAVHFIDRYTGWAAGFTGTIIKTTNGGASWVKQTTGTTEVLRSICFIDANNGWAAGDNGTMLATTNGGTDWAPQGVGIFSANALYDVDFYNASEGAAVGYDGVIYATVNGGLDWLVKAPPSGTLRTWHDVEYVAPSTYFVGGEWKDLTVDFSLLKTANGGGVFAAMPLDQSPGSDWASHGTIFDMEFLDANNGWVASLDGTIARTTDGGMTWAYEKVADELIEELDVVNAGAIWAGGTGGRLLSNYAFYPTTVYRFYRPSTGTHFYTSDVNEKHYIINNLSSIYTYEGPGYVYDDYYANQPLYRFFKPSTGTHFFTADPNERDHVIATLGGLFTYEGPVYNISNTYTPGALTVYRFYRPKSGTHFYTADPAERDNVIATLGATYAYEGPVYYLPQ